MAKASSSNERRFGAIRHVLVYVLNAKNRIANYLGTLKSKAAKVCACEPKTKAAQQTEKIIAQSIFQEVELQNQESASISKGWMGEGIYVNPNTAGYRLPDEWVSPSGSKPPTHAAPVIRQ